MEVIQFYAAEKRQRRDVPDRVYRLDHRVRSFNHFQKFTALLAGVCGNHLFTVSYVFQKCGGKTEGKSAVPSVLQPAEKAVQYAERIPDFYL